MADLIDRDAVLAEEEQFEQDLIDRILMEDDKTLIGYFCMHIGYDWKDKPEHDPAIYPEWSAVTKAIWNEIERRMKGTVVHEFDYDGAIEKLTDKADDLRYHLHKPSAECSYFYGYVRALEEAKEIVRKARRSKRWKPKREVKDENAG